jgi:hypothetical protein
LHDRRARAILRALRWKVENFVQLSIVAHARGVSLLWR